MFVVIAYDRELILSRSTTEQHLEQLEASMQLRFDEGDLRGVELTRVQIEHEKARIETAKIMAVASQHKNQLDLWLGGNLPDDFEVQFDLEDLPAVIALEDALSHAGSENPLVMAGVLKLQASELGVKAQKHAAFPEMAIGGFVNKELDATNYGGVFSMSIPLWNWNKAGIDEAAAQKIMAESEQDALVLQLQSRVIVAHCGASMNRQAAESYIEDVLPKVLTSVEDVQTAYDEGDADLLDLIDARRTQATTHLELLSVLLAFHLDVIELETLMGGHSS
jgi:cobalt-zinc-cadmium efflux system outer membrane protein